MADAPLVFDAAALAGRTRRHIRQYEAPRFAATPATGAAFLAMRAAAREDGLDLRPFSSFRDLKTQVRIWNRKFRLERPIYDQTGATLDGAEMSAEERVWAILGWSALPGASRHHWGTEIDVVDGAVVDAGHTVDLLPYETAPGGPFRRLHDWLDAHIAAFGFFRPYREWRGGMFSEPWHLSHEAEADGAFDALTLETLRDTIAHIDLDGKEAVVALLPEIYDRHVRNICVRNVCVDPPTRTEPP